MNNSLSIFLLSVLITCHPVFGAGSSLMVDSEQAMLEAMQQAQPGDAVIIADGDYNNVLFNLTAKGTESDPITVRSESPGGVRILGKSQIRITGQYIHLKGLVFRDCVTDGQSLIDFDQSEYCEAVHISFEHCSGNRPMVQFRTGSKHNLLSNSQFTDIAGRSVHVQVNDTIRERGIPVGNIIRENTFMDIPPLGGNGRETVKIGQSQPEFGHIKTRTLVENNLFIRCDGEAEIISNKAASNIFRENTFIDCKGELVMRGGHDCLIEQNHFFGCSGGIRLSGTGHVVKNNVIIRSNGTGIRLLYGMTREQGGHYQAVSRCRILNNMIIDAGRMGILVGEGRNNDGKEKGVQKFAPENNQFIDNLIVSGNDNFLHVNHAPDNMFARNRFHRR